MPKTMMHPHESEMDSLYSEDEPMPKGDGKGETVDQENEEGNTAVAPVKVLMGKGQSPLKEGDEVVVKIVKVYGDEAEFTYSNTKPSEVGGGEEKSADTELDEMNQAGDGQY